MCYNYVTAWIVFNVKRLLTKKMSKERPYKKFSRSSYFRAFFLASRIFFWFEGFVSSLKTGWSEGEGLRPLTIWEIKNLSAVLSEMMDNNHNNMMRWVKASHFYSHDLFILSLHVWSVSSQREKKGLHLPNVVLILLLSASDLLIDEA